MTKIESNEVKLSLFIPTYNRGSKLMMTLGSLTCQTLPRELWEVIVVNNNSTDDTAELFDGFAAAHRDINVRMVIEMQPGVSYARNRGVAESRGAYIVEVDDDELMNEEFLQQYYDLFQSRPDVMAAGGKIVPQYESKPPRWLSPWTERPIVGTIDFGRRIRPIPKGKFFGGGNHGVRREMFERHGVYRTDLGRLGNVLLGGEEKDLYMRFKAAGAVMYYLPDAVIRHMVEPERLTPEYFRKLCLQIGRSERVRTKAIGQGAYLKRLLAEVVKWCGALAIAFGYLVTLRPAKSKYLIVMRWQISRGLLAK